MDLVVWTIHISQTFTSLQQAFITTMAHIKVRPNLMERGGTLSIMNTGAIKEKLHQTKIVGVIKQVGMITTISLVDEQDIVDKKIVSGIMTTMTNLD